MGLLGGFGMFSGSSGGGGGGIVESVVAGRNITVDNTDPANPIVATTADDITVVANYSALPSAGTVSGDFYWCSASQGTAWLPGSLGGTYYSAGLYYSNGVSWEFLSVPYQATQATVDTGTNTDQFVTPATFTNASKWATKQDSLTFSTGLTNSANTITANLSTGVSGGQTATGGTGAGDQLTLKATTGNGTSTVAGITFKVGNNGATTPMNMYNSGQVLVNYSTVNPTSLGIFRVAQGTSVIDIGESSAGRGAVWLGSASGTPTTTNFSIATDVGANTLINSVTNILFQISGTSKLSILSSAQTLTSSYQIISSNGIKGGSNDGTILSIGYTATTSLGSGFATTGRNVVFDGVTYNDTSAGGGSTVASNPHVYVKRPTYSATNSGRIITDCATLQVQNAPTTSGGNVTLTNAYAFWVESGATKFSGRVLRSQGADVASSGDLTLGADGNSFEITGTTTINAIITSGWQNGASVTLLFTSTPTVKHNTAGGAGTAVILLAGAVDFSATAGDTLTLLLSEIGGTQAWREIGRAVI